MAIVVAFFTQVFLQFNDLIAITAVIATLLILLFPKGPSILTLIWAAAVTLGVFGQACIYYSLDPLPNVGAFFQFPPMLINVLLGFSLAVVILKVLFQPSPTPMKYNRPVHYNR